MSRHVPPAHEIDQINKRNRHQQDSGWQPTPLHAPLPWDPTTGHMDRTPRAIITNIDGREITPDTGRGERPAYNPDVPRWD